MRRAGLWFLLMLFLTWPFGAAARADDALDAYAADV